MSGTVRAPRIFNQMQQDTHTLRYFWNCTRRYPLWLAATIGLAMLAVCADSGVPLLIASALDKLTQGNVAWHSLIAPGVAICLLQALGVFSWHFGIRALWVLEMNVRRDLAERTFTHIASQSEQFHLDNFGGALVADQTKFVSAFERLLDEFVFSYFTTFATVVFIVFALVWTMWWFVVALTVMSCLYMAVGVRSRQREIPQSELVATSHSRQTAQIADTVTNVATVRSFGREQHEDHLYEGRTGVYVDDEMELMRLNTSGFLAAETVNRVTLVIALAVSIVAVKDWGEQVGAILIVVTYTQSLLSRLHQVQRSLKNVVKALGDARSMMTILDSEPTVSDIQHPKNFDLTAGAVEFRVVTFGYPGRTKLFEHFDLVIEPGQRVGLVGASGSGKTTLSKLVLRFIDLDAGKILIDGQDISQVGQADLRQQVTYVPQEPLLFHRSITDNIAYGRPQTAVDEVVDAASLSRASEFIDQLPLGYDTLVGERGTKLSGGQRQRIAIARAFLKRTPLLILDEATSALDSHSEALIQEALGELMHGQTAIVIAHRLSTVAGLDRIVVLDDGRVIEDGSHEQLLKTGSVYAGLWARQTGGFMAER